MIPRNPRLAALKAGYLFPEIAKRRREFAAAHPEDPRRPETRIISLGVGNTTEPILPCITEGLAEGAGKLGTAEGYSGYQDEGLPELRKRIADVFYRGAFSIDEIFISDGAKCDIGRLQLLFGPGTPAVIQDPSYPVYVDGSVLIGAAGAWAGTGYTGICYLPCTAENNYFPDLSLVPENALIYFCSPNNPTGAVASREQLGTLVNIARQRGCIIVFDAAYSEYIRNPALPKTIYEIPGAGECAIEVNSFSKPAGFTGVRLGWTVVPKELRYEGGESINTDWSRIASTIFNGASNIAQAGGLAALSEEGLKEIRRYCDFYLRNAALIRGALQKRGISCVGGDNSPYIWAHFPGRDSWDIFTEILEKCRLVSTPGSGFGPSGQSFIRFSAFGRLSDVEEACRRLSAFRMTTN
ncbi:MAG: LL-diaminopimelate aminotransferase [Treponema sp.]|jgi:LL-diaminopimelate aminotransferase|nr:LL-diaminopimelate aminotransferase [Treponema sp.]